MATIGDLKAALALAESKIAEAVAERERVVQVVMAMAEAKITAAVMDRESAANDLRAAEEAAASQPAATGLEAAASPQPAAGEAATGEAAVSWQPAAVEPAQMEVSEERQTTGLEAASTSRPEVGQQRESAEEAAKKDAEEPLVRPSLAYFEITKGKTSAARLPRMVFEKRVSVLQIPLDSVMRSKQLFCCGDDAAQLASKWPLLQKLCDSDPAVLRGLGNWWGRIPPFLEDVSLDDCRTGRTPVLGALRVGDLLVCDRSAEAISVLVRRKGEATMLRFARSESNSADRVTAHLSYLRSNVGRSSTQKKQAAAITPTQEPAPSPPDSTAEAAKRRRGAPAPSVVQEAPGGTSNVEDAIPEKKSPNLLEETSDALKKKRKRKKKKKKQPEEEGVAQAVIPSADSEDSSSMDANQEQEPASSTLVPSSYTSEQPAPWTVFVGNLDFDSVRSNYEMESNLRALFKQVLNVRLAEDGQSFGHVDFESLKAAKAAIELNGSQFLGSAIKVNMADKQAKRRFPPNQPPHYLFKQQTATVPHYYHHHPQEQQERTPFTRKPQPAGQFNN